MSRLRFSRQPSVSPLFILSRRASNAAVLRHMPIRHRRPTSSLRHYSARERGSFVLARQCRKFPNQGRPRRRRRRRRRRATNTRNYIPSFIAMEERAITLRSKLHSYIEKLWNKGQFGHFSPLRDLVHKRDCDTESPLLRNHLTQTSFILNYKICHTFGVTYLYEIHSDWGALNGDGNLLNILWVRL